MFVATFHPSVPTQRVYQMRLKAPEHVGQCGATTAEISLSLWDPALDFFGTLRLLPWHVRAPPPPRLVARDTFQILPYSFSPPSLPPLCLFWICGSINYYVSIYSRGWDFNFLFQFGYAYLFLSFPFLEDIWFWKASRPEIIIVGWKISFNF